MTDTTPSKPRPTDTPSPWEMLPTEQRTRVADEVASAVKRGELALSEFERACNDMAQTILDGKPVTTQTQTVAEPLSQHELRSEIEDAAAISMSAALPPNPEQVARAKQKLLQLPMQDQGKINAAIDAHVNHQKNRHGGRLTIISRVLAREKWLVALMEDDAKVQEILAQPAVLAEGRWPR
jgi:rRNA maturation endonuclease Nob1